MIQFADVTGDSFKLAQQAAARPDSEFIIFCGVHFMAESADILTTDDQSVVLPDMAAGCSMADMAAADQVQAAWQTLEAAGVADVTIPVTYMNPLQPSKPSPVSTAALSAPPATPTSPWPGPSSRVRRCCSARPASWAQHRGPAAGLSLDDCVVFDPTSPAGLQQGATARGEDDPVARSPQRARPFHRGKC